MSVHRIGFTELSGGQGARDGSYRANIIFVHGLGGHPQRTWEDNRDKGSGDRGDKDAGTTTLRKRDILTAFFKSKPSSSASTSATTSIADNVTSEERPSKLFWPAEYLTRDIPDARVWTYGYNADAIGGLFQASNKNSVSQHGRDFAVRFEREIQNEDPILFVAHSLGGIIVKDAICRSEACRARTKLIIFLGTPHRGSASAGWGEIASNLALLALQDSNKKIIKTLEVNSEVLDNIHEKFKTIADQSRIRIHSFQEARGISGMKGLHSKVVDDFSSKLDLPQSLETVESIDANHMQMARCGDRSDPRYHAVVAVLKHFMRTVLDRNGTRLQETSSTTSGVEASAEEIGGGIDGALMNSTALPCYYNLLPENLRFVGRNDELDTLKKNLFERKESRKAAIVGLGGVGKTQVALQLAYWTKKNRPEFSIFWVPVLSNATFEQAFAAMARELPIRGGGDDEDPKESVRRYLSSKAAGPWLLVVDNADDRDTLFGSADMPGGISKYLPESDDGLTLFTTRSQEVAVSVAGSDVIELEAMSPQEAAVFLEKSLIQKDMLRDEEAAAELLKKLDYLPLAIAQAVAYININKVLLAKYIKLLQGTPQDVIRLMSREFTDSTRYPESRNAVATTWLVSFDQIRKSDKAAADLLSFVSCIEPKGIPESLFPRSESPVQLVDAIGTLSGYAFLARRGDSEIFDMHSLVHLAARVWVQREGLTATAVEKATRHLAAVFPSHEYTNRSVWREYLPHAFRVLQHSEGLDIEARSYLLLRVGLCLRMDGRTKEAVRNLEEACRWKDRHFTKEHPARLAWQDALAVAYSANGQVQEAMALIRKVEAIREQDLAEDHPDRLASQHELAIACLANGQVQEAVALLRKVVAIQEQVLAEDHPSRLASQLVLAIAYQANGQVQEAIALLRKVVAIQEQVLAKDHPDQLASQHSLAVAYLANGQVQEAIALLRKVVAIREQVLAKDHPSQLASQHELAVACLANGQVQEAMALLIKVVAIREQVLAKDHPNRLASQHALAVAYQANSQVQEAVALLRKVVAIREQVLAEDHPDRLASQQLLASMLD